MQACPPLLNPWGHASVISSVFMRCSRAKWEHFLGVGRRRLGGHRQAKGVLSQPGTGLLCSDPLWLLGAPDCSGAPCTRGPLARTCTHVRVHVCVWVGRQETDSRSVTLT